MKPKIVSAMFLLIILCSCSNKHDYKFILTVEEVTFNGEVITTDEEPKYISAENDSIAYMDAFSKFMLSKKVHLDMKSAFENTFTTPVDFKLLNSNGENIATKTTFKDKSKLEQEMKEQILSLPNALKGRMDKKNGEISEIEFGKKWPFTVKSGRLQCLDGNAVIFICDKGTYAINGMALNQIKQQKWLEIDEIWKDDPNIPDFKISISPIILRGLELCK